MKVYVKFLILGLCVITLPLFSQEICDNGIDDDGDGFIDLNDDNCNCPESIVINPSFDGDCNDFDYGWETSFGSGYASFSTCGNQSTPPISSPPSPDYAQLYTNLYSGGASILQCLAIPLMAGSTYDFEFDYISVLNPGSVGPVIHVYGIVNCPDDYYNNNPFCASFGGPGSGYPGPLEPIFTNNLPANQSAWENITFSYTPSNNIEGILVTTGCYNTFGNQLGHSIITQFTNFNIFGATQAALSDPTFSGNACSGLTVTADLSSVPGANIQWYLDGIAIDNATSDQYNIPIGTTGNISYSANDVFLCFNSEEIEIPEPLILEISADVENNPCKDDSQGTINIAVNNGDPIYTFQWDNGLTSQNLDNLEDGTYSVEVTDANGCTGVASFTINSPSELSGSILQIDDINPFTGFGGAVVTGEQGTPNYTYQWSNGETGPAAIQLPPGINTVTITDANGCTTVLEVNIKYIPLVADIQSTQENCIGDCQGIVNITVDGGLFPYTIEWDDGETSGLSRENMCSGSYQATVIDDLGTSIVLDVVIEDHALIQPSIEVINPECNNTDQTGNIYIIEIQGEGPFTINWSNGSVDDSLFFLQPDDYILTITDFNNCFYDTTLTISSELGFDLDFEKNDVSCFGLNDGSIEVVLPQPTGIYSILWNTGDTTSSLDNLPVGIYEYTISSNQSDCSLNQSVQIKEPDTIGYSILVTDSICHNSNNGEISILITDSELFDTIFWDNNISGLNAIGLATGRYSFSIIDTSGCLQQNSIQIANYDTTRLDAIIKNPTCNEENGKISLIGIDTSKIESIDWGNHSDQFQIDSLSTGNYFVQIIDQFGCLDSATYTLESIPSVPYNINVIDSICPETQNGSISIESNNIESLNITWSTGESTNSISSLTEGKYAYKIIDSTGCITEDTIQINAFSKPNYVVDKYNETCSLASDGSIEISNLSSSIQGILWQDSFNGAIRNDLPPGTFYFTITDINECSYSDSVTIENGVLINYQVEIDSAQCEGDTTIIKITPQQDIYKILWDDGTNDSIRFVTNVGTISLSIEDPVSGCTVDSTIEIATKNALNINSSVINTTCGDDNGSITIDGINNIDDFVLQWENGDDSNSIENLAPGLYKVSITDIDGCTSVFNYTVEDSQLPIVQITAQGIRCHGDLTGSISVSYLDNFEINEYLVNGVLYQNENPILAQGEYQIQVFDSLGCLQDFEIVLDQPNPLISFVEVINQDFLNNGDGVARVEVNGGTSPYVIDWSNGDSGNEVNNLIPGNYTITVTDNNGCISNLAFTIEGSFLTVETQQNNILCEKECTGEILISPTGSHPPFEIIWDDDNTKSFERNNLCPGTYSASIYDAVGNVISDTLIQIESISENILVDFGIKKDTIIILENENNTIELFVSPIDAIDSIYIFSNEQLICQGDSDCLELNLSAISQGVLTVEILSKNGCYYTFEKYIQLQPSDIPNFVIPNVINTSSSVNGIWTFRFPEEFTIESTVVYDRWGNKVYMVNNEIPKWNGTMNGRILNSGVFVYVVTYLDQEGSKQTIGGDITVLN